MAKGTIPGAGHNRLPGLVSCAIHVECGFQDRLNDGFRVRRHRSIEMPRGSAPDSRTSYISDASSNALTPINLHHTLVSYSGPRVQDLIPRRLHIITHYLKI